jgi:rhamnosyltransferase
MTSAQLTAIVRTYNSSTTLGAAITSLREQSVPVEVLVVDSGSTDGTLELARGTADRVLRIPSGQFSYGGALNLGARAATTPVHAALSSHCSLPHEHWARGVVEHILDGPAVAVCGQPSGPDGQPLDAPLVADHAFLRRHPFWGFSNHGSAWAASAWSRCEFDESLPSSEDREWSWRVTEPGGVIVFDPALSVGGGHRREAGTRSYYQRLVKEGTALLPWRPLPPYGLAQAARDLVATHPDQPLISGARRGGRTRAIEVAARYRASRVAARRTPPRGSR